MNELDILFKTIQYLALLVQQQTAAFRGFICRLCDLTGLKGLLTAIQRERIHVNEENEENLFLKGMFALQKDNVLVYVNGLGSHVRIMFTNLDDEELHETLVQSVAESIVNLADGVQSIQPE